MKKNWDVESKWLDQIKKVTVFLYRRTEATYHFDISYKKLPKMVDSKKLKKKGGN